MEAMEKTINYANYGRARIGLKLTGESWFVLFICQGLIVVLTTGLLVGLIIDLVLESFRD